MKFLNKKVIISVLCICTLTFLGVRHLHKVFSDGTPPSSTPSNTNVLEFLKSSDYDKGEFQGKKLIQKADFVGKIKITKLKEHVDRIEKKPAPSGSIAEEQGEKTVGERYIYDVYQAEVLDSYKNPKDLKTIEIFDFKNVYEEGTYSNVEFKENDIYVVYLAYHTDMKQYRVMSLSDGIFKLDKISGKLKGYNRDEDIEKHKKFVKDNKD